MVLIDDIYKRRLESRQLIALLRRERIASVSSMFASMELLDFVQIRQYLNNKIAQNMDVDDIMKSKTQRDLRLDELTFLAQALGNEYQVSYKDFMSFFDLKQDGWNKAIGIKALSNVTSADCIHIATALECGCNLFVTRDTFMLREITGILESVKTPTNAPNILPCTPEGALKALETLGIK